MKIYKGGTIRTIRQGIVEAIAIDAGRVCAVGTLAEVRAAAGTCEEVSLNGHCMLPGFIDSHCHLQLTGVQSRRLDMRGVRSAREMIERGRTYIRENNIPEGTWIVSDGYDQNRFDIPEMPTRDIADAITDRHPLLLQRICGHVGTLNTRGLEAMGYDVNTRIEGGMLDIGTDGDLTGILRENALYRVTSSLPKASEPADIADLLACGMRRMNSHGVTSVHSDDMEGIDLDKLDEAVDILRESGRMTVRLFEELLTPENDDLEYYIRCGCRTGEGDDFYKYGNIKLILDGSLGAKTAYMSSEYANGNGCGINVYSDEQVARFIARANAAGLQTACHAIGDAAAEQCICGVEAALAACPTELRHRVVHGQFLRDEQLERMYDAGMAVDAQPAFLASDWRPAEAALTPQQCAIGYRWRSMLEAGLIVGAGSDSPVEECDPIMGIYHAVTRRDTGGDPQGGWHPEECVTVQEALEMYTVNGARLSFEEKIKGDLMPGMLADMVILSEDICTCDPERIPQIRVLETIVGGETVYTVK